MSAPEARTLAVEWPWWLHPAWALLLVTGGTATGTVLLSDGAFSIWNTRSFLSTGLKLTLLLGIAAFTLGIAVASPMRSSAVRASISISKDRAEFLVRAYRTLLVLTVLGYIFWLGVAVTHGVSIQDVSAVISREQSALRNLKENARPVAGLTTLTQFGPVAVSLGFILNRLGLVGRGYLIVVALATVRTVFYAERLALLEVVIPLAVLAAVTTSRTGRARALVRVGPILGAPLVWMLFAASEYTRSWVHYQHTTDSGFFEWVTLRMLGYYATAYNNSALFATAHDRVAADPFFTFQGLWNAPGASALFGTPQIAGMPAEDWWQYTLARSSTPEFNNFGSFLMTFGELGYWMIPLWIVMGIIIGLVFVSLTKGRVVALVAYPVLFVGLLELPRMLYWTEGRATPLFVALVGLSLLLPRSRPERRRPERRAAGVTGTPLREVPTSISE